MSVKGIVCNKIIKCRVSRSAIPEINKCQLKTECVGWIVNSCIAIGRVREKICTNISTQLTKQSQLWFVFLYSSKSNLTFAKATSLLLLPRQTSSPWSPDRVFRRLAVVTKCKFNVHKAMTYFLPAAAAGRSPHSIHLFQPLAGQAKVKEEIFQFPRVNSARAISSNSCHDYAIIWHSCCHIRLQHIH